MALSQLHGRMAHTVVYSNIGRLTFSMGWPDVLAEVEDIMKTPFPLSLPSSLFNLHYHLSSWSGRALRLCDN